MNRNIKTSKLTFLGVMLALTIVFVALTAIPTTSASMALLIFLPTIITSVIHGPKSGAAMGFLAGLTTLLRALLAPASPLDYLFLNPLVAILPRIFIGIVPYYVFKLFKKLIKSNSVSLLVAGVSGALTNTALVILMLYVIYSDEIVKISTEFGIGTTFAAFAMFLVTTSALIECSVAGTGTAAVASVYYKIKKVGEFMILAVDIGNSNIVIGVYDGDDIVGNWRMVTRSEKTSDEYGIFILSLLKHSNIDKNKIKSAIVSSVVPNVMHSFENALRKYFNIDPIIVGPGVKTGITISTDNPREVGADRIVGLVAAYDTFGGPLIVIDFGTATTYDVVSEKGEFKYGITSPGIQISADALWQRTAQLPSVEIKRPDSILAKNTVTSIQAGLVYGYIGQVEYIIKKIKEELKVDSMKVIATGGLGRIIYEGTNMIDVYDPQLLFKGLKVIHDKNYKSN